jgi:hypothetical protein
MYFNTTNGGNNITAVFGPPSNPAKYPCSSTTITNTIAYPINMTQLWTCHIGIGVGAALQFHLRWCSNRTMTAITKSSIECGISANFNATTYFRYPPPIITAGTLSDNGTTTTQLIAPNSLGQSTLLPTLLPPPVVHHYAIYNGCVLGVTFQGFNFLPSASDFLV